MGHKKGANLFLPVTHRNQRILTQFSLLDLKMNGTFDGMNFTTSPN